MCREVICKEILFTVNLTIAKSAHKLLLKNLSVNLETSMKIAFADFTELLLNLLTYLNRSTELQ